MALYQSFVANDDVTPACYLLVIRIVTYILRAVVAKGHLSLGLTIAESLLLSVGFVLLVRSKFYRRMIVLELTDYLVSPLDRAVRPSYETVC